jgi:hypothetical protein
VHPPKLQAHFQLNQLCNTCGQGPDQQVC